MPKLQILKYAEANKLVDSRTEFRSEGTMTLMDEGGQIMNLNNDLNNLIYIYLFN